MRRTLWIPALTTMLLLMVAGSASAQPIGTSAPEAPASGPELDDVKNEGERRRTKRSKRRSDRKETRRDRRSDRRETRSDRRRDRRETRSDRRDRRSDRREVRRDRRDRREVRSERRYNRRDRRSTYERRRARRAYREQQRRRAWREARIYRPRRPRVVVHAPRRPVVVVHDHDHDHGHSASAPAPRPKRNGLSAGWRHVGGGFGTAWVPEFEAATPMGRFELGAGGYTKGLYGGGGLEIAGSSDVPIAATGVGYVGLAIPVPVVHPLVGIKVGGGAHLDRESFAPHVTVGPQAGVIVRPYDGQFGLRVMFDVEAVIRPTKGEIAPQAMLTFAGVF